MKLEAAAVSSNAPPKRITCVVAVSRSRAWTGCAFHSASSPVGSKVCSFMAASQLGQLRAQRGQRLFVLQLAGQLVDLRRAVLAEELGLGDVQLPALEDAGELTVQL